MIYMRAQRLSRFLSWTFLRKPNFISLLDLKTTWLDSWALLQRTQSIPSLRSAIPISTYGTGHAHHGWLLPVNDSARTPSTFCEKISGSSAFTAMYAVKLVNLPCLRFWVNVNGVSIWRPCTAGHHANHFLWAVLRGATFVLSLLQ